jgi:hypothetical protein
MIADEGRVVAIRYNSLSQVVSLLAMSPDIEWQVGENAEQETIARTTPTHRSPRRRWIVISAIGLGVVLGLLYRSIPEPPPKPIGSAPIPTVIASPSRSVLRPTPQSLDAAIERDALRLASSAGEGTHLIAFTAAGDKFADWYAALQNAFGRWGTSPAQALYTVSVSGTLPGGAWVTLGQYRHGAVYQATRFYRLENDRWVWSLPDRGFWSGATSVITTRAAGPPGPIILQYPIEDAPLISPVVDRFSSVYQNLCASLKCPTPNDRSPLQTLGLTVSLTIKPMFIQPAVRTSGNTVQIDLPSPNVVGVYDDANALGDPYVALAYDTLIDPVVRLASGDYARWDTNSGGSLFLQAIATWKRARLPNNLYLHDVFFQAASLWPSIAYLNNGQPVSRRDFYVDQLRGVKLFPLTNLWTWPPAGNDAATLEPAALQEAKAVIIYIEERYGPDGVVRFLNALGKARSSETAIQTALAIDYAEFDQRWTKWIAGQ